MASMLEMVESLMGMLHTFIRFIPLGIYSFAYLNAAIFKDTKGAIIWTIYLSLKAGLQIYFFNNPEILVVIKLATSNQSTLILLVISYIVGQRSLQNLNGPSVEEFVNNLPEPWISQQKGF